MSERPSAISRFFGAALIAVGALITLLSGACTGYFVFMNIASLFLPHHAFNSELLAISLVGGAPIIIIGVALIVLGRWLARGSDR